MGDELYLLRSYDHEARKYDPKKRAVRRGQGQPSRASNFQTTNSMSTSLQDPVEYFRRTQPVNYGPASRMEIWQVARGATAADAYFEPFRVPKPNGDQAYATYTDGGYGIHINPTVVGFEEIEERHGKDSANTVVSVGTCRPFAPSNSSLVARFLRKVANSWDPQKPHGYMLGLSEERSFRYSRFDEENALHLELDSWKPRQDRWLGNRPSGSQTVQEIERVFHEWASKPDNYEGIERCAKTLVETRRMRTQRSSKWEAFATGVIYRCPKTLCESSNFYERDELRHHLQHTHGYENVVGNEIETELTDAIHRRWKYEKQPKG